MVECLKHSIVTKHKVWNSPPDHVRGGFHPVPTMEADVANPDSSLQCNVLQLQSLHPDPLITAGEGLAAPIHCEH